MILKNSGRVLKSDKENFYFDFENVKRGKITSRVLPNLLGESNFNSIGKTMLDRYGLLEFIEIDYFWTFRGEIAEYLAYEYLVKYFESKNESIEIKKHALNMYEGFDLFNISYDWGNKDFGGVPDITIKVLSNNDKIVVEVKSKNESAYEYIVGNKNIPNDELLQARHLATLMNYNKVLMVYVFFTKAQEEDIKVWIKKGLNLNQLIEMGEFDNLSQFNIKIAFREVGSEEVITLREKALKNLNFHLEKGYIPKHYFLKEEVDILEKIIEENKLLKVDDEDGEKQGFDKDLF